MPHHEKQFARNRAFSAPFHCAPMPASYGCAWLRYCSGSSGLPHRYHDNAPAFHRYPPASWQLPVHIPARCHARPSEFPPDKLLPPYGLYFASYSAATQNMFKYTQTYREIEVLTDTSYCFKVYAFAAASNTLFTGPCILHSLKIPK